MSYGGLKQVADLYNETCIKHGTKPGRLMCSYFCHFLRHAAAGGGAARPPDPLLQRMRDPGVPGDPKTAPPSYSYFIAMVERLQKVKAGAPHREFRSVR